MEQMLINELVKLLCKGGCDNLIGNFQRDLDADGSSDPWRDDELKEAVHHVKYLNDYFGREEAASIIVSLAAKYNIDLGNLSSHNQSAAPVEARGLSSDQGWHENLV